MRQTSWYIWAHSSRGSTLTSRSATRSAPSPGFTGVALGTITYCGGAPTSSASRSAGRSHTQQHLLTIGGQIEEADIVGELFALAGLQVKAVERRAATETAAGGWFQQEQDSGTSGGQAEIIARGQR